MKKHFEIHRGVNACIRSRKDNMTTNWQDVTCERCKMNDEFKQARQLWKEANDKPNLRRALKDKVELYIFSNDKKDIIKFQEIAFELGVFWVNRERLKHTDSHTIGALEKFINYRLFYDIDTQNTELKQFSLKDDCFVDEIERSSCGRTLDEFLKACNDDCSNVFNIVSNEYTTYNKKELIKLFKDESSQLEYYSIWNSLIKEPINYTCNSCGYIMTKSEAELDVMTKKHANIHYAEKKIQDTISEDEMNDIKNILKRGVDCRVKFSTSSKLTMMSEAYAIKRNALLEAQEIINKIRGN